MYKLIDDKALLSHCTQIAATFVKGRDKNLTDGSRELPVDIARISRSTPTSTECGTLTRTARLAVFRDTTFLPTSGWHGAFCVFLGDRVSENTGSAVLGPTARLATTLFEDFQPAPVYATQPRRALLHLRGPSAHACAVDVRSAREPCLNRTHPSRARRGFPEHFPNRTHPKP